MRWILAVLAPVLVAGQTRIDHVSIAGAHLDALRERLSHAGLATEYGGKHANGLTEMAFVSFPDGSYLELIAPQTNADLQQVANHPWAKEFASEGQPAAWAARVKDFTGEVQRLKAAGESVEVQPRTGRVRPDGVTLEWQTATIGQPLDAAVFPFLIQDFTLRQRRAQPSGRASTRQFSGIRYVVVGVKNLTSGIERYRQAFAVPPPIKQVDRTRNVQLALLGNVPVILAAPLTSDSELAERLAQYGEGPIGVILTARTFGKKRTYPSSRWFGEDVSWIEPNTLGWWLGYE